jgi:hypothetical protein
MERNAENHAEPLRLSPASISLHAMHSIPGIGHHSYFWLLLAFRWGATRDNTKLCQKCSQFPLSLISAGTLSLLPEKAKE